MNRKNFTIAIAGNPNCGKTTLFNGLTGGKQSVGNWPGVTVEKKEGKLKIDNRNITIVDLPGVYSLSAYSEDEEAARNYLLSGEPDLVINVLDASNLERNLYLTTQMIEMKIRMILVLNMVDVAEKKNIFVNQELLSKKLGTHVFALTSTNKEQVEKLKGQLANYDFSSAYIKAEVHYPDDIERLLQKWKEALEPVAKAFGSSTRWAGIKLFENDPWVTEKVVQSKAMNRQTLTEEIRKVENLLGETGDVLIADYRYGFIAGITKEVITRKESDNRSISEEIDKVVLNKYLGIPIFLFMMFLLFSFTLDFGGKFIDFFSIFFSSIFVDGVRKLLTSLHAPAGIITLFADGVGGGITTVSTFIPIIFSMFFILSLLEDSGYMARAAFIMDRFMRYLGLPGKAFVSLIIGFGCTVPAILSSRTLENKKDRLLTVFMTPFMSCGARLPVYVLFSAAFFPKNSGTIVFFIYLTGILFSILTGLLLKKTLFQGEPSYFIMELPPYHLPRIKHILIHTWGKLKDFVWRAGKVIVAAVILLGLFNAIHWEEKGFSFDNKKTETSLLVLTAKQVTPIFTPMGIEKENWPATVALFSGLFAKESVIGTLNSLYGQMEEPSLLENDVNNFTASPETTPINSITASFFLALSSIYDNFSGNQKDQGNESFHLLRQHFSSEDGEISPLSFQNKETQWKAKMRALSYMLFVLLYFPCLATVGAVAREIGNKRAIFMAIYMTLLAWTVSTFFFQLTAGHNLFFLLLPLLLCVFFIGALSFISPFLKRGK